MENVTVSAAAAENGGGGGEAKRKRGRPRKETAQELITAPARGRGRPRGSGKWQMLAASLGGSCTDTGGSNFTPYIVTVEEGENIVEKIRSFSQMTSESICILSASGSISRAEISVPGSILRYEGQFNIVCLNGSHTYDQNRGTAKICHLSVQLASPDGRLCGGAVAASLIAASPTQNIVEKIRSFSQMTSESICILSASGSISRAEISVPGSILRYEGQFNIVCLNGSHTYDQNRGTAKICHLSVQLASPDGRLCGGAVAASLIAASPTQLTIATFRQKPRQQPISTNPYYPTPPNPNNNIAQEAMQADNGRVSDGAAAPAQQSDEAVPNAPNPIQSSSSAQPLDWKSLRTSASA